MKFRTYDVDRYFSHNKMCTVCVGALRKCLRASLFDKQKKVVVFTFCACMLVGFLAVLFVKKLRWVNQGGTAGVQYSTTISR